MLFIPTSGKDYAYVSGSSLGPSRLKTQSPFLDTHHDQRSELSELEV